MATVTSLVESFVKANVSSIIGLISTLIIMIIGYKLNTVLQQSARDTCPSPTQTHQHAMCAKPAPIHSHSKLNGEASSSNSPHHRRNGRICSCACPYNKISLSSINKYDYGEHLECMDNIHRLLTSEILDLLITGFVLIDIDSISSDIISLITLYSNHYTQLFVIKGSHKGRLEWLNTIECINLNHKLAYNMTIYNVNAHTKDDDASLSLSTMDRTWDTEENGVCLLSSVNVNKLVSKAVIDQINTMYEYMDCVERDGPYFDVNSTYNAIIKCAGMKALGSNLSVNNKASMTIFKQDPHDYLMDDHEMIGFEICLPPLPRSQTYCAQTVYSSRYGLITNCRDNAFLFDINKYVCDMKEEWKRLSPMNHRRNWASSLCVIDDDRKLFICSGDGAMTKSVEIYDIARDEWRSMADMNDSFLMQSGIYYDYLQERVIVGGGYKTEQMITSYDIGKDVWIDLPNTRFPHSEYPSIWCNKFVMNNVLYIAGNSRNDLGVLEFVDLRDANKKWNLAPNEMQLNQYIETPQIYKHNNAAQMSSHHRDESNYYPMEIRRAFV
eukprot:74813_1